MLKVQRFEIEGPLLLTQSVFKDERGSFMEAYAKRDFADALGPINFVQDNIGQSTKRGTLRGMHFQTRPCAQAKLLRVLRGAVFDAIVDLRRDSPSFGRCLAFRLEADTGEALFIPKGFAHGYCSLEDDTQVLYKVDEYFSPEHCRTFRWSDPNVAIEWPIARDELVILPRDANAPLLAELDLD
jgi:dTDP-4-dehydrorhamnose 3,5-epimerase